MNGRVYDPVLARFLSPDPYVQAPDYTQNFNRYSYCYNNPFKYTDPSGEFIFTLAALIAAPFTGGASLSLLPYAVGADLGMWQGGSLANGGELNPMKWDYSSGKTWGYMLGGTAVGLVFGYIGVEVATGGGFMANTAGIMISSFVNSAAEHSIQDFEVRANILSRDFFGKSYVNSFQYPLTYQLHQNPFSIFTPSNIEISLKNYFNMVILYHFNCLCYEKVFYIYFY